MLIKIIKWWSQVNRDDAEKTPRARKAKAPWNNAWILRNCHVTGPNVVLNRSDSFHRSTCEGSNIPTSQPTFKTIRGHSTPILRKQHGDTATSKEHRSIWCGVQLFRILIDSQKYIRLTKKPSVYRKSKLKFGVKTYYLRQLSEVEIHNWKPRYLSRYSDWTVYGL